MCGIAGIINIEREQEIPEASLRRMISMVKHRGPDGFGYYRDKRAGLAHARLSIIDLEGGWQPIYNENKNLSIVFNGEIFNYVELREQLIKQGHVFYTHSDTETIIHLYEEYGADCLNYLNGQFAFAIWDRDQQSVFIARDRVGIRPLFYTRLNNQFLFASEIKSLFADNRVDREIDPFALDQIFTFWMTIPPRTAFKNISELPAGHYLTIKKGVIEIRQYWDLDFSPHETYRSEEEYADQLRELLIDSTRLQLRADVPVGAYLSGGIDSSVITAIIKQYTKTPLRTFSVTFQDEAFDESEYQRQMIDHLQTDHSDIKCSYSDIGRIFPEVIWHTEKPILRTAPAPLFLLSKLVRESGYKVVLTGEGSDEILAGYDIFKEIKVRRFLERNPKSAWRPLILKKLYPYLANSPVRSVAYAQSFFGADRGAFPERYVSHVPRWNTTSMIKGFYSDGIKQKLSSSSVVSEIASYLPAKEFTDGVSQAQYIEIKTLLSGYLLSSQGDRVAMANSIEGRFPFLDHRVVEFCVKLPPSLRMKALTEKYILKKSMKDLLPKSIVQRTKQPYMAPDAKSFFNSGSSPYYRELLSESNITKTGYFNPRMVQALVNKSANNPSLGFKDNMAIVGIISTILLHERFIQRDAFRNSESDVHAIIDIDAVKRSEMQL